MSTTNFPGAPPIDIAPRDWAGVVRILHEQVPAMEVWAFGSRAKHTAKPYSDLDLALITQQPLSLDPLSLQCQSV
jgi:predicted nucleotidyltransferase